MTSCAQGELSVSVAVKGSVDDAFSNRALARANAQDSAAAVMS
jgi:hypothetical protein